MISFKDVIGKGICGDATICFRKPIRLRACAARSITMLLRRVIMTRELCAFDMEFFDYFCIDRKRLASIPKQPRRVTACGYQTGLQVLLNTFSKDYHSTDSATRGFKVSSLKKACNKMNKHFFRSSSTTPTISPMQTLLCERFLKELRHTLAFYQNPPTVHLMSIGCRKTNETVWPITRSWWTLCCIIRTAIVWRNVERIL